MANRFKESIKHRGNEIVNIAKEEVEEPKKQVSNGSSEDKIETKEESVGFNISSILNVEKEKKYSNKTYYLEDKVIDEIKRLSKSETKKNKGNVSESKIVNDILKHVLNIK